MTEKLQNIILITIDCLRADHMGCYGYPRDTSPYLDSLASKAILFEQAISNGCGTPFAFPAILASTFSPLRFDPDEYKNFIKTHVKIAEVLKENGYQTAAFHSNGFLSRLYNYDMGFDTFDDGILNNKKKSDKKDKKVYSAEEILKAIKKLTHILDKYPKFLKFLGNMRSLFFIDIIPPYTRAEEINDKAIHWLRNHSDKFFLWLHYMDVHPPLIPPREYLRQFCSQPVSSLKRFKLTNKAHKGQDIISEQEREILVSLYDASIKYVDTAIGSLLNELKRANLYDNTIIIVTADHGTQLGERGIFAHRGTYESLIHVPLIISIPKMDRNIIKDQVSLLDLAPTIVDLLGIPEVESFYGKSLLPVIKGEKRGSSVIMSIGVHDMPDGRDKEIGISCRTENWKYIHTVASDGIKEEMSLELYDPKKDPGEMNNLHSKEREKAKEFELLRLYFVSHLRKKREKENIKERIKRLKDSNSIYR